MPALGNKLRDDLTEQWFMDSLVKQLQQVIPLKFQTMEIKFAPLQTVHLSRAFKLLLKLGGSSAVIALPLVIHSAFPVIEYIRKRVDKIMETSNNRHISKHLKGVQLEDVEYRDVGKQNLFIHFFQFQTIKILSQTYVQNNNLLV